MADAKAKAHMADAKQKVRETKGKEEAETHPKNFAGVT